MTLGLVLRATGSYLSVAAATLAGIIGMGMLFSAAMHGQVAPVFTGLPLLLIGLWWAGRALGRATHLAQARRRFVVGPGPGGE